MIGKILAASLILAVTGCGYRSDEAGTGAGNERLVSVSDIIGSPGSYLGRVVCAKVFSVHSYHGMVVLDRPDSEWGLVAEFYPVDVDTKADESFVEWLNARVDGQAWLLARGELQSSDRVPKFPYEFRVLDVIGFASVPAGAADLKRLDDMGCRSHPQAVLNSHTSSTSFWGG